MTSCNRLITEGKAEDCSVEGVKRAVGNEYSECADKLAYNISAMAMKGSLSTEFIKYKLKERRRAAAEPKQRREKPGYDSVDVQLDFNLQYDKENQERRKCRAEERALVRNYFDNLLSGETAKEHIKLLSTRFKNRKI